VPGRRCPSTAGWWYVEMGEVTNSCDQLKELAAGPPARWLVTLDDGSQVEVWADAVTALSGPEDERDYTFGVFMDIEPEDQDGFEVTARTPRGDRRRVEVAVTRFPRVSVRKVMSG